MTDPIDRRDEGGLPPEPWTYEKIRHEGYAVLAADRRCICIVINEPEAKAIADIPEREREIAKLRETTEIQAQEICAEMEAATEKFQEQEREIVKLRDNAKRVDAANDHGGDLVSNLVVRQREQEREITRLRAALAHSKSPCVYCSLPVDEWAKCKSGFPGCDRADDAMGCPELGASMQVAKQEREITRLRAALEALQIQALQSDVNKPSNEWGQEALEMARCALAGDANVKEVKGFDGDWEGSND